MPPLPEPDPALSALADRIAAGETIDVALLPAALLARADVQHLLQLGRVMGALARPMAPAAPVAPDRIGPWRLVRLLGSGGMGEVWLGERVDGTVDHRVALKRVRGAVPRFATRLAAERRILARLSHTHIARFIDAGVDDRGEPWLALEYVDGEMLTAWCDRTRPSLAARLQLFLKLCDAVSHAHRQLVVHRDLKPGNVLVDAAGEPRLLDFGIAKLLDERSDEPTLSAATPAYAAPEQLRGEAVSTATDVYALGLLLFRLLAGVLPRTRSEASLAAVLAQLDHEETQRPSASARGSTALPYPAAALAGDLDAIVSKALRAAPEARYGSVEAMADDVRRHLAQRPVRARSPTRRYLVGRFLRRHRLPMALTAVALLALFAGIGLALWQARRAEAAAAAEATEARRADEAAKQAASQARRATRSAQFVLSVFQQADLLKRDGRGVISIDDAFEDALQRIDREFSDDAMVAADLNDDFGEILASKGRFDEAIARFDKALALAEEAHGPDSIAVAESLANRAAVASYLGKPLDGRDDIVRAIGILEHRSDADPLHLANIRMAYVNVLVHADQAHAAQQQADAALAAYRQHLPAGDQRLSVMLANLGALHFNLGHWVQAAPYLEEALAAAEALQGEDSAALLPILDFLGTTQDHLGRHAEAEATVRRTLAIADATYPEAHPARATPRMELGYHLLRQGQVDAGLALIAEGRAMHARLDSPLELLGVVWQSRGLLAQERWAEALAATVAGAARCAHFKQPESSRCLELRGHALQARARMPGETVSLTEVDRLLAEIDRTQAGGDARIEAQRARAEVLSRAGQSTEAVMMYDEVLRGLTSRYVPQHRDVAWAEARRRAIE